MGKTSKNKLGLLGYPIDHSLSPTIHRAAYRELGLDWSYELYPCPNMQSFSDTVSMARQDPDGFIGFNVTTPYKFLAFEQSDQHSKHSSGVANANVLTFAEGVLHSDNTDGRGLVGALERALVSAGAKQGSAFEGLQAVMCGSGAVAMSGLLALLDTPLTEVSLLCRNVVKCEKLVREMLVRAGMPNEFDADTGKLWRIKLWDFSDEAKALENADILVDATTVGMLAGDLPVISTHLLKPGMLVFDVVYGHGETELLKAARSIGAMAVDGLDMLVEQGALAIEIWAQSLGMSIEAPREVMRAAALDAS